MTIYLEWSPVWQKNAPIVKFLWYLSLAQLDMVLPNVITSNVITGADPMQWCHICYESVAEATPTGTVLGTLVHSFFNLLIDGIVSLSSNLRRS